MNKLVKKLMLVAAMLMLAAGPSFAADAMPQIKEKQFQLTEEEYNTVSGLMERAGSIFHRDREIHGKNFLQRV